MDGGIFASAPQDTLICDVSTIHPDGAKSFYAEAKKQNMCYLDTPMSGGVTGARNGTLTFMVGGTEAEFEASKGVLQGMGANFFHCGEPGTGCIAKITNNLILGISMVATSEGMAIGEKLGIDPVTLQKILAVSTGRNWCVDTYNPRPGILPNVPASNNYEGGFAVGLIKKDMVLALEAAHSVEARTDMLEKSLQYYIDLEKAGCGKKDFGYVFQYIMKNKNL
jgi:3-hydroxyisobutyrate dehydrogenase